MLSFKEIALIEEMSRCRNRPNWLYLFSTRRGNTMLLILLLCVAGIILTYDLYDKAFPSNETKIVSSKGSLVEANAEIDYVTPVDVTAEFVTDPQPGENESRPEEPSTDTADILLNTFPPPVLSYLGEYYEGYGEPEENSEDIVITGENHTIVGRSSAFTSVIPLKNDLGIVHQKRLLWCTHCFFFAYNLIVVIVHIFDKMFLKSKYDIYKRTTTMTLMYNWMLTFLAVMSIKGTGYLMIPFVLELALTFLVTFIKCKIYPEISLVTEDSVEDQIAEAHGDVSPQEQILLEEYVNHHLVTGSGEDANLSNAEEGHATTAISDDEDAMLLEDRVDVGDVGLQYHDESGEITATKEPETTNLSFKNKGDKL